MEIFNGKFNEIKAFVEDLDEAARVQLKQLCDQEFAKDLKIRVMPDAHAGKGCVIGTTMTIRDKIVPNLVGVDIGCGMETVKLAAGELDFRKLDKAIKHFVPVGKGVRKTAHRRAEESRVFDLTCGDEIFGGEDADKLKTWAIKSLGSLGGGNHFIEIDKDEANGDLYLIVHSGSRNPGNCVAVAHQNKANMTCSADVPKDLAWLEGDGFDAYMHDMRIMQEYADLNRKIIVEELLRAMDWQAIDSFTTVHNYVDFDDMILRKGAISAAKGKRILIPFNMRDGSLICEGLGNEDWNCSAPHGAGRAFSRAQAFKRFSLEQFREQMQGIYSSCINRSTIDESPLAYKPKESILPLLGETVKITNVLKPIYNFKAGN